MTEVPKSIPLSDLSSDVLRKRIQYDNEMLDFLQEKRRLVCDELVRIDGQIKGLTGDKTQLFEALGHKVDRDIQKKMDQSGNS